MDEAEFEAKIRQAPTPHDRIAWFGALLATESGLGPRLTIVGGSAIEIYLTSDRYVSDDIDIVGDKAALTPILERWGFEKKNGRDRRVYWARDGVGLVDLVGTVKRVGLPDRQERTPFGEVALAPVEALIIRRLIRASRENSDELARQAEALALEYGKGLDWDYLQVEAKYERILPLFREFNERVRKAV